MVSPAQRVELERIARQSRSARSAAFRARIVLECASGVNNAAVAAKLRTTGFTVGLWRNRFIAEGVAGLGDEPRPGAPREVGDEKIERIVRLTLENAPMGATHWSSRMLAAKTGLSQSTISRIWRAFGLKPYRAEGFQLSSDPLLVDKVRDIVGLYLDLLHLDIKGMTQFGEVSLRGDGRLRGKQKHPGFLALHVAIDDHSRMAFTQMLPDQKADTTIGFLNSAIEFFATHGIAIRALLTDNGSSYRSRQFRQACQQMAIKHSRTRPYTPRTNGKAERFIQTALREWAYAKHWTDSQERDQYLQPWNDYYNHKDPM